MKKIICLIISVVMLVGMLPIAALARTRRIVPVDSGNSLNMSVTSSGTLTWDAVEGATGYSVMLTKPNISKLHSWDVTSNYFNLITEMDSFKYDSGQYIIVVTAKGVIGADETMLYYYTSHVDKLESPNNLVWIGDKAAWDAVEGATSYNVALYDFSGQVVTIPTTECLYDFSGSSPQDGWTFRVQALSNGTWSAKRYSDYVESPAKGSRTRELTQVDSVNSLNMRVTSSGTLDWDDVSGATGYRVVLTQPNITELYHWDVTNSYINLITEMDSFKYDSGQYIISVTAKGVGGADDTMLYYYTSHVDKLESPNNLVWIGDKAAWDSVEGATSYNVSLYDFSGNVVTIPTTECLYDFSGSSPKNGWTFCVQALSDGKWSSERYSDYAESPARDMPLTTYSIGAYVYDDTLGVDDSGGRVYLSTDTGTDGWSNSGYIKEATEGATVTVSAEAAEGYKFVEWRQGTKGVTISTEANYEFEVTEHKYLYAIFQADDTVVDFPENAGSSVDNPVVCNSYLEFKYAMENPNIYYVALGDVKDMLPYVPHEPEVDDNRATSIVVRGNKDLNLLGDAIFTCPVVVNYDYKTYEQLLTLTDAANSNLYIHGKGSLTFEGGNMYFYNSAIKVAGGNLTVDEATVRGSNGNHSGYCYGINALYGSLSFQNGATIIGGLYEGHGICALSLGSESIERSLSVSIWDGNFYVERAVVGGYTFGGEYIPYVDYGISVNNDCGLRIYSMTTEGIELERYAADTLDDYVMDGYTMVVDGVKTNPASSGTTDATVEVYNEISDVNIHINSPIAGESLSIYSDEVYMVPEGCTVQRITWFCNDEAVDTSFGDARFETGESYKVEIALTADSGTKFANPLTSATINNKTATVTAQDIGAEYGIILKADLGECPATVPNVDLTITAPKEGNKPSYTVGCGSDTYYAVGGASNYTDYRQWYMSSDGYDWWLINGNHTFMAGYYYKVYVDIHTMNGYEFPLYDNGSSIVPGVSATVNGYNANVIKAYDQDPSSYITVEYNFGECNDSIVENVTVVGVTEPVAGEYPTYSYSILGSGYSMDTGKNAYYDAYWKNPPEKWYYIKNGIGWFDMTDSDWVYENEKFIPGHEYQVNVYLKADDGYEFYHDKWYDMLISATVNGNEAGFDNSGSSCAINQKITYTFSCKQQEVSTLMLYLDAPEAGKTPSDYKVESAYPEVYGADESYAFGGIYWYDCEGNMLTEDEEFIQGMQYKVEIKVVPTKVSGVNMCTFADDVNVILNGNTLSEYGDWDAVYASNNVVYIYYTFRKAAQAPEVAVDPIEVYRSGNNCIVKLNESETGAVYIAAAYSGNTLIKAVTLNVNDSATLTGDTVKVFCWVEGKIEPIKEAIISTNQ